MKEKERGYFEKMEMQKKGKVRHFLAKLLLVTMLLSNLETGSLAKGWVTSSWAANNVQASTSSDAEELDFEMLFDDVTPGWQSRLLWMHQARGSLASASVASPSDYGIEIKATQNDLYVSNGYWFNMLAAYEGTQNEIEEEYEDSFKLVVVNIDCPAGGSYSDSTGATQFKPAVNDIGKIYSVTYVVQYWTAEGIWEDVPDTGITLDYEVVEQEKVDDNNDFTFIQLQETLLIGKNYDMSALAEIFCDDASVERNNYRIAIQQVVIPSGGSYDDEFGGEEFTPTYADQNLTYEIIYVIERTEDDGATWQLVNGKTGTFEYEVKEAQYDLRIEVPASAIARVDKEYKYIDGNNMAVLASPSELGGVTFELAVDRVESATITKTFDPTATGYTPDADDKDQVFQVIYRVVKHYPAESGKTDEYALGSDGQPLEAVTSVEVIGEGVRDTITSDDGKVKELKVAIQDGSGTMDSDDEPGNDSSNTNGRVRSFDTITYNLEYTTTTDSKDQYKNARLYFEIELPLTYSQAQFDTAAMGLMDTTSAYMWKVETDPDTSYQTLKCFYQITETVDKDGNPAYAVPNTGTFPIMINVYAMNNGEAIEPTFKASVAYVEDGEIKTYGTYDEPYEMTPKAVIVSAAPRYNVQLRKVSDSYVSAKKTWDFSEGSAGAPNQGHAPVYGNLLGYGITLQLYNEDTTRGLKGIEFPSGPISFDLEFANKYIDGDKLEHDVDTPLIWSLNRNTGGAAQRPLPDGMNTYAYNAAPYNGSLNRMPSVPFTAASKTTQVDSCWNGGTWTVIQDSAGIHVTVEDYVINPFWFPHADTTWTGTRYYEVGDKVGNTGCFSAGALYLVVPFGGDSGNADPEYYPVKYPAGSEGNCQTTIKDTNFRAETITGQIVDDADDAYPSQVYKKDDSLTDTVQLRRPGSWSQRFMYQKTVGGGESGLDGILLGPDRNAGTDSQCVGGELAIGQAFYYIINGDEDNVVTFANMLMKFDDQALVIDKNKAIVITTSKVRTPNVVILYGAKTDKTGWTDDAEMNTAVIEDLKYYASLDDLESAGAVCVAVLTETHYDDINVEIFGEQWFGFVSVPFKVKSDASIAGNVYQTTSVYTFWQRPEAKEVLAKYNGEYPSRLNMAPGEKIDPQPNYYNQKRDYVKSSYPDGVFTPGKGGEPYWGDSLYIVPYEARIKKYVEQFANDEQTEAKVNYDLSMQQYIADYVLKPTFYFGANVAPPSSTSTTVTITDVLPAGLTYRSGTAVLGGTYQASTTTGMQGAVDGGTSFEPSVKHNTDGTQTLTWVIEGQLLSDTIPAIHYSCDIDMDSIAGTEYINTVNINTTEDARLPKETYGNMDTANIKVHAPAMMVAKKKADALFVDAESPLGFTLQWSNRSMDPYLNQVFMDSMPFDSDEKGSKFGGGYTIEELLITPPSTKTLGDYICYYTMDDAASDKNASDFNFADFTTSSCTSSGINWTQATMEADGTIPELEGKTPGAWVILGDLHGSESLMAHVTMDAHGNDAGDMYVNQISVGAIELTATTRLVQRELAGVVWLDSNYDGQRQASERRLGGVLVELLMKQTDPNTGEVSWVAAVNVKGQLCAAVTTDNIGSYKFTNLAAGEFKVVFSRGGINLGEYRATTRKASGVAVSVNSDAEGFYDENGVLKSAEITGITMPAAEDITSSPYVINYQDFGVIEAIIPTKTYNDSMKNGQTVKVGDKINYRITYGNDDTTEACDIIITDVLDKGLTIQRNTISNGGVWQPDPTGKTGGTITWTLMNVAPKTLNGYVTFSAVVNQKAAGNMKIENSANLKYTFETHEEREYKVGPLVNPLWEEEQPGVKGYEVTVRKDSDPAPGSLIAAGDTIKYFLEVKNTGTATALYTVVRDYIPEGTTYINDSVSIKDRAQGAYVSDHAYVEWVVKDLAPNEVITLSFSVTVNNDPPKHILNVAHYSSQEEEPGKPGEVPDEPETPTNEILHTTDPDEPVPAYLVAVKDADPAPGTEMASNETITYSITIKNNGGQTATNVYVKDSIPAKTTFKSVPADNNGQYQKGGNYVSWLIPAIEAGKSVTVSFAVMVKEPTDGSMIINQAAYEKDWKLNQDGTPKEGDDPSNSTNIVEHPTSVEKPNLEAVKSSSPVSGTKVNSGNTIVYTITVTNVSETDAKDVYVRDYIPEYMRYVSAANDGSYNSESNYVSWNVGMVKAGESASVSFTARVLSTAVNKEVRNYALYEDDWNPENTGDPENRTNEVVHPVFSSGGSGGGGGGGTTPTNPTDPTTPGGNSGEPGIPTTPLNPNQVPGGYITTNEREEGIQVRKNVDKTAAEAGNRVTYTITVYNNQDLVTEPMTMVDHLPAYTSFISCTDGTYFADGGYGYVEWHIPALQPYEKKSFKLVLRLDECMPNDYMVENTAYIQLDSIDDGPVATNRVQTVLVPLGSLARTGDNARTWMLLLIVVLDAMAIAGMSYRRRRKKR